MPSPMMPPQKRKRFAPIRGRNEGSGGRRQHNRFHGGRGRGRGGVGIDAYYDRFMFEDPWRDLMPPTEETVVEKEQSVDTSVESSTRPSDEPVGSERAVEACSEECRAILQQTAGLASPSSHDERSSDMKDV